jgi:hypothetical protein
MRLRSTLLVLALATAAFGCGEEESPDPAAAVVVLNAAAGPLQPGETFQFNANIDGVPGAAAQWGIQEGGVAGSITANGLFTAGTTAGTYHVIAQSLSEPVGADTAEVTVIMTIAINGATTPMGPAMQRQFTSTVSGGTPTVNWTLPAGPTAGTISNTGLYTAGAVGTHLIVATTATLPAVADTISVTVIPDPATPVFHTLPDSVNPFAASHVFSVVKQTGLTYAWTITGGVALSAVTDTAVSVRVNMTAPTLILHASATNEAGRSASVTDTLGLLDRIDDVSGASYGVALSSANVLGQMRLGDGLVDLRAGAAATLLHSVPYAGLPVHGAFSGNGATLFVVNQSGNSVARINVATGGITSVDFGHEMYNLAVAPDSSAIFVTTGTGWLFKADPTTLAKLDSVPLNAASNGLAFRAGKLRVGTLGGRIYNIDPATLDVIDSVTVAGAQFQRTAISPDGVRFYLADQANAQLVIMNTTTNGITLLPLGATPSGVAISEDASELWVGKLDGTVARLHPTAFTALGPVTVGGEVRNIALSPDGTLALLGIGSGTVLIRR